MGTSRRRKPSREMRAEILWHAIEIKLDKLDRSRRGRLPEVPQVWIDQIADAAAELIRLVGPEEVLRDRPRKEGGVRFLDGDPKWAGPSWKERGSSGPG